jgi:LAS seventeen-binding protein 5
VAPLTVDSKYGNPHRQIRALTILDGLIQNAGQRFQQTFADEPLLERLRLLPREDVVDPQVREKCRVLFIQWANGYKNVPGLERIANLYKELPKTQRPQAARQKVLQETERFDSDTEPPINTPPSRSRATSSATNPVTLSTTPSSSFSSSKLSKKKNSGQPKPFNLSKERENMTQSIAQASIASINLLNGIQLINRERERVSQNAECVRRFETCKQLRRKILYYIQNVESDEWIGSLVNANDELVKALTAYEITDRSIDDDSDSEEWDGDDAPAPKAPTPHMSSTQQQLAGLKLEEAAPAKPPRPGNITMPSPPKMSAPVAKDEDDEDDDPFGDSNAAPTPYHERDGMTWREV